MGWVASRKLYAARAVAPTSLLPARDGPEQKKKRPDWDGNHAEQPKPIPTLRRANGKEHDRPGLELLSVEDNLGHGWSPVHDRPSPWAATRLRIPASMIAPVDDFPTDLERRVLQAFGPGGMLARSKDFEYRPQQQTMAAAVAKACQTRTHLLVEAGTGVGKIARLSRARRAARAEREPQGARFHPHDQFAGAAFLQGHPARAEAAARSLQGGAAEGPA